MPIMGVGNSTIVPSVARIQYHPQSNDFRLRISTYVSRPDGTRYEVDIETSADLGAILGFLIQAWTGTRYGLDDAVLPFTLPSSVAIPIGPMEYGHAALLDAGTDTDAALGTDKDDVAMVLALDGP